jgi:hypothetical protein
LSNQRRRSRPCAALNGMVKYKRVEMITRLGGLPKSICKRLCDSGVMVRIIGMGIGVCGRFGGDEVRGVEDWVG